MNREYFVEIARYNFWANDIAIKWLKEITVDQWEQEVASSFPSIRRTALHIASAEKVWNDFLRKESTPVFLSASFTGTREELFTIWKQASSDLKDVAETFPEEDYQQWIRFTRPNRQQGQMRFWQGFSNIVNHSAYHRGQLVTMLRQVGFTNLASTDLSTYYLLTNG